MRKYIVVVNTDACKVIQVYETEPIGNDNIWKISKILSDLWVTTSTNYPPPTYDVILGSWINRREAQGQIGRFSGWESVPTESIGTVP